MPGRKVPLVAGEYYHIYNRGVAKMKTFFDHTSYNRFITLIHYYQNSKPQYKFSFLARMGDEKLEAVIRKMRERGDFLVKIHTFTLITLMQNYFHFILEQLVNKGISQFMSQVENSYTKFINTRYKRVGSLFQGKFKAVHVQTEEQLMHLSRYHHLNPLTSGIVKKIGGLEVYSYSFFPDYIGEQVHEFVEVGTISSQFKNKDSYKKFVVR